jgi:hypothetical protein
VIYQLRGTCAAGKSTVVRQLFDTYGPGESVDVGPEHPFAHPKGKGKEGMKPKTHIGYRLPGDLMLLGVYGKPRGGGFEGGNQDWSRMVVEAAAKSYSHVVFEGYYMSQASNVWFPILERLRDEHAIALPFVIKTLDTPWEICQERIHARTPERQAVKPTNDEVQLEHFNQLHKRVMPKFVARPDLCRAEWVNHLTAYDDLEKELRNAGWCP